MMIYGTNLWLSLEANNVGPIACTYGMGADRHIVLSGFHHRAIASKNCHMVVALIGVGPIEDEVAR